MVRHRFTFADYLRLEAASTVKHEYLDGQAWAMAGGTPEHSAVAVNITTLLSNHLRGQPCRVYSSDLRVRVPSTGLATYPDVSVVCGRLELDPEDPSGTTVTNPRVLIEVLSPSTEEYDRGDKLVQYRSIPSVEDIVLVDIERHVVMVHRRGATGWQLRRYVAGAARLGSLRCDLPLAEIFRDPMAG